jgi:phosphoglycerate kinase
LKRTLESLESQPLEGERALVRVDFNVPIKDGKVTDAKRIVGALPTIEWLRQRGCRVVLMSHLGRPKGKRVAEFSLEPVAAELERQLGVPVQFIEDPLAAEAEGRTRKMKRGDVALVENTRFYDGESRNDAELAQGLAKLGDFYVNDAFGSAHRAHASTEAVAHLLKPAVAGFLMERELQYLQSALAEPERPFIAVLGGAKISGKIDAIEALLPKVDEILIGGAMACTFFLAMGFEVGESLVSIRMPRYEVWRATRFPPDGPCTTSMKTAETISCGGSSGRRPWSGMVPWVCSRHLHSMRERWPWRAVWLQQRTAAQRPLWVGVIPPQR